MKLREYMQLTELGAEITVIDNEYDCEMYFYNNGFDTDDWNNSMIELSKKLNITKILSDRVEVDFSILIEHNIDNLNKADLFYYCDVDSIMDDMNSIMSGAVSEDWLKTFVDCLKN